MNSLIANLLWLIHLVYMKRAMIRKNDQCNAAVSKLEKKLRVHSKKSKEDCIIIAIVLIIIIIYITSLSL